MKIIILSDTHGSKKNMDNLVPMIKSDIDLIIHAGDNFRDSVYLKNMTDVPVLAVVGNCDFENSEENIEFELEGIKFFLTHGHKYGVKYGLEKIAQEGSRRDVDIVIFGHTHEKEKSIMNGIQLINPGSLRIPRDGIEKSYVIMKLENGIYEYEFRFL
ncbi:metallophosphoesterase family protein [Peptostreptococcus faecalis]|uniref:metallophosphoesterase family protein n=1 Tax=Peptostreptococcus faecalis TaxID=2045015 RepID=UPI000C7D6C63|nr:metallophosphoesterase [Peptostreptococcus faecalis]